jgi:ribosome maturation factor RimP
MAERDELMRIAEEIARDEGVELYWLEYKKTPGRWLLQVMIDKEGGVTLDDCARVSRALEGPFDERIPHSYLLEVSSPGLDRPLHTERHFRRVIGQRIWVKTYAPIQGQRAWEGRLLAVEAGVIRLETPQGPVEIPRNVLASARVSPDFDLA